MKKYLQWGIMVVLEIGLIAFCAWKILSADVGGPEVTYIRRCLPGLGTPSPMATVPPLCATDDAHFACATHWWQFWWHPVEVSATPASWQFWLHPTPTTFFSVVAPVLTATP